MTKKRILFLLLICLVSLLALCSCNIVDTTGEVADSISLVATDMNVEVGSFNPSNYTLLVSYNTGRTEKVTLTSDMIPVTETTKFYQFGQKTIKIEAFGQTCEATFNVTRKQIKDVYIDGFTYNQRSDVYYLSTTYTGKDNVIKVAGDIPAGSTFSFPQGQNFSKVGSYDFVVYISCENYETKKLVGNITINKAKYDMSSVKFDGIDEKNICQKTYDGTRKDLKLTGTIPNGVSVNYKIQSSKSGEQFEDWPYSAGNYYVYATFESDTVSYEPIPDMVAYLTIAKKQIKLDEINFDDQEVVYDGKEHTFSLTNEDLITVSSNQYYSYVELAYENNVQTNAGKYIVKANLTPKDSTNYEIVKKVKATDGEAERYEVITQLMAYATIKQAEYDVSFITLDNDSFQYDGKTHSLQAVFEKTKEGKENVLPIGVNMFFENNGQTDAGTYDVYLKFTHNNLNYAQIEPIKALLRILPLKLDMTGVAFDIDEPLVTYDGTIYQPKLIASSLPSQISEVTYKYISTVTIGGETISDEVDKCQNAANYSLIASFTGVTKNYEIPSDITSSFTILTRTITDSDITYETIEGNAFEYDGTPKHLSVVSCPYDAQVSYRIVDEWNFDIADPTIPGNYYQETLLTYFNGYETVTYESLAISMQIRFTIDNTYFDFSNKVTTYSGQEQSPKFVWLNTSPRYSLLKDEFKTIYYQYKEYGASDTTYTSQCPTETGQYECKAVFSDYVTYIVANARVEYVTTILTINQVIVNWDDIMQFSLNDTEDITGAFGDLTYYDFATATNVTVKDTYAQEYEIVYDGKKRTISPNSELKQLGQFTYDIIYGYGDCMNNAYSQYSTDTSLFNITKAGLYVIKVCFNVNKNAIMTVTNDMYLVIKYDMLRYDEDLFGTQKVYKVNTNGTPFDTSKISAILNPSVRKYEYDSNVTYKPLSYNESQVEEYYVYLDLMFDETDEYIDYSSFSSAVADPTKGIMSITDNGVVDGYRSLTIKIKVIYV